MKSWQKGNWCSNKLPPLSIDLPSIFNINSHAQITWPIVDLGSVQSLLESGINSDLDFFNDNSAMFKEDYDRKAIKLVIYADTIILNKDVILTNLKSLTIIARKIIIEKSSNPTITLKTIAKARLSWQKDTAPGMDYFFISAIRLHSLFIS